jgi:flagellar protein FliS
MSYTASASQEYLKSAVMTASPEQLQLMLLDGAIRFSTRGIDAIRAEDIEGSYNAFERAQRIVLELSNGLRRDVNPTLVDEMAALYNFIYRRLVDANMHRDVAAAEEAIKILRHQRETWSLLIEKLTKELGADAKSTQPPGGDPPSKPVLSIEG